MLRQLSYSPDTGRAGKRVDHEGDGAAVETDDAEEPERAIVFLDIQGFSRSERTDEDRAAIRRNLQEIAQDLLSRIGAVGEMSDTGDGLLLVLSAPVLTDGRLLSRFYPAMERRLAEHNRRYPRARQIRLRMVFGQGASRTDIAALTGTGVVSTAVNRTARLLDSEPLRNDLESAVDRSVGLMVSDAFLTSTVVPKNPSLSIAFRRVLVRAKDGVQLAWIYRPGYRQVPGRLSPAHGGGHRLLPDLPPHLTVSTFDVHVHRLYEQVQLTVPLEWQLAAALLLSHGAIVHCADPYRRDEARTVLERYREFVENGDIVFLLGASVRDIRRDYRTYLESKAHDYARSQHSERDVQSLEAPLHRADALERAIHLLESSPWRVRRGYSGTRQFQLAVRRDIRPGEEMVSALRPVRKLRMVNLTLHQLLTLSYVADGRVRRAIADPARMDRFLEELDLLLQQAIISRQIVLGALRDHFGKELTEHETLLGLIEARVHSLYMSATTFPHGHTEVTPRRDQQSPYHYGHLRDHLQVLSDDDGFPELSPALVRALRDDPAWPAFARHHLSCVAEVAALRLADRDADPEPVFRRHSISGSFPGLATVIARHR